MLEKDIDPPADILDEESDQSYEWLDDLAREYEEDEAAALHSYECRIFKERTFA